MNIQELIDNHLKSERTETLSKSDQLTLGEMILKLKPIVKLRPDVLVRLNMGDFRPKGIDSWRGSYAELALEYDESAQMNATEFLEMMEGAVGKTYIGYKGGEFKMSRHTPVWVSNYGHADNIGVIDVVDDEHGIIIITEYCDFL